MAHYIDADRLKTDIERRRLSNRYIDTEGYESELIDIIDSLQQEQPQVADASKMAQPELPGYDKALLEVKSKVDELYEEASIGLNEYDSGLYNGIAETCMKLRGFIKARLDSDEQPVDLEKFTEKIKTFQARYKHPESIPIKGAMAFMARMFYQYPNVARQWYDSLPKATMD